ncbi:MAG TPA: glycoside hydrolase family 3 C-terminal domain-containing protein [Bryobacteraceae bacterium]|nr:glycoside hydrolase family 3 C-terminal domain-containing protein [Bryobacteraceae bacterium]
MRLHWPLSLALVAGALAAALSAQAPGGMPGGMGQGGRGGRGGAPPVTGPWSDATLSPDRRAELLAGQMTLDEKISILHGAGFGFAAPAPAAPGATVSNGGAGFVSAVPRLGIPAIQMADAAVGVTRGAANSRYSTPLPNTVSAASTWDVKMACEYGALIGQELRDQGYTMSLGGGVNITREPRNGRNFEYKGEDPILAGKLVGQEMKCLQAKGIIGDIKHFAVNDQETGRNIGNAILDNRTLRETDLLPFEIGIHDGDIQAVMCSYNKINGDWACENNYLMNDFLKKSLGFKGFVVSDWGGTHSTAKAAMAGLDMEQPGSNFFGDPLKQAIEKGELPAGRLDDMVKRILRAQFATGQFDLRTQRKVVEVFAGLDLAQRVAERGTVLLKNSNAQLPLRKATLKTVAIIGSHADVGVLSGGGSAQVDPPGGNAVPPPPPPAGQAGRGMFGGAPTWYPSSPMKAIQAKIPGAKVQFDGGSDPATAAALAKASDVAVVFVNQPASEGRDLNLALPDNQDRLVDAVVAANPRTIVVLETGGPVSMPWADKVPAILESWYPGIRGGEAIANLLFGDVNPSGKTVMTFARSESDWAYDKVFAPPPSATAPAPPAQATGGPGGFGGGRGGMAPFDMPYREGLKVGYKWFDAEKKSPLFAFGHGLSYTTFSYSGLKATPGKETSVTFTVKNTGTRAGIEIAQVYATLPASTNEPPKRLVAFEPVELKAGESKTVTLTVPALHISIFDEGRNGWQVADGDYTFWVGGSSRSLPLSAVVKIAD